MRAPLHYLVFAVMAALFLTPGTLHAQRVRGELRIEVHDSGGATVTADARLLSEANQVNRTFKIPQDGRYTVQDLPFGVYRLNVNAEGFASWSKLVDIRSEVPLRIPVTLGVAPVATQIQVTDSATLVDPSRTGTIYSVGRQTIDQQMAAQPGRNLSDLVNQHPGWLYEANGVLHPRGSEYDVQYIFDGLPLTQNRSPAFAPEFDADDVESMRVLTATFPAEYGRKLGGVVEVTTVKDVPDGLHGQFDLNGGSFSSISSSAAVSYAFGENRFSISGNGFHTDRYLDPPVLENFTNRGNAGGFSASYEREFSGSDRLRLTIIHNAVRFLVPNELVQQQAGQRQAITNLETSGQIFFQHTISPNLFLSLSGSVREASADLTSNVLATPVIVSQSRGYRESYARADLVGHKGHHNWKSGVDTLFTPVHEALRYTIADPAQFDPATQQQFQFADHKWDVEPSAYVQDELHLGNWNISAGLRFDHYGFVVHESAWSPRLGVSRYVSSLNLLLHASYDRVFQTPAMENLLLASSAQLNAIDPVVLRLPVRPARGNYYEVGATKSVSGKLRIEANIFRRDFHNYPDDDTLLDTGVSFPIAFSHARIFGEELRLEVPEWWRFSGYLSYSNQSGIGSGPITGGLFLGSDAAGALTNASQFAVSQDQRNTARARVRFQAEKRVWGAMSFQYGSGLPATLSSTETQSFLLAQYGSAIVDRVNFDRQRTRPTFSLDIAAGAQLYRKELRSAALQIQVSNVTNRVNLLNFASLFSGTAVSIPRSVSGGLKLTF
ncbi:MAG TPA: TonB-dependent receptor plug domain-containing protein [Candidatus Acidoferrum sp.]|nr:TonB-dependent receptor plug domain-containing protein [Candidatus Acidoferrum sp.]